MNDDQEKCRELGNYFEFMPNSDGSVNQSSLSTLFLKHPIIDSVTFFGGSFNPFHRGHRACLDLCPEKNILIVIDRNPFKDHTYQNQKSHVYADFLKLAESMKETHYSFYPGFLGVNGPNPTSSWLPKVRIAERNFLMGDDSYMSLLTWKNPGEFLRALTKLYVVPRNFSRADYLAQERLIKKENPALDVIYLSDHPYKNISSTELRLEKKK
jgi:nicotinate-nucleotide adenylyltransferase